MTSEARESKVWCVWTELGEYEQHSRDLRGVFATEELARAHAAQLVGYDVCEALEEDVLDEVPLKVPYLRWSAYIEPDDPVDLNCRRDEETTMWSNEITAAEGTMERAHRSKPGFYIEVCGCDADAVKVEYERLLDLARQQLASEGGHGAT